MELVGKQMVSFTDRSTGELIEGIKLHYTGVENGVVGLAALTQFIRKDHPCYDKACNLKLGNFNIIYGRRNSVQDILEG